MIELVNINGEDSDKYICSRTFIENLGNVLIFSLFLLPFMELSQFLHLLAKRSNIDLALHDTPPTSSIPFFESELFIGSPNTFFYY